jgi:hypothetical protein
LTALIEDPTRAREKEIATEDGAQRAAARIDRLLATASARAAEALP